MQAIILAGGAGVRLRPLTFLTPKPLLKLINKPILDYIVQILKVSGITEIILTTDYLSDPLQDYIKKNQFGLKIISHKIKNFQGTAQILSEIAPLLQDEFLVLNGDCIFDLNLEQIIKKFRKHKAVVGMLIRQGSDLFSKGQISLNREDKSLNSIFNDAWIYYFKKEILEIIPEQQYFDIHLDLIIKAQKSKLPLKTYELKNFWAVLGRIHPYLAANFWLLNNLGSNQYIGAHTQIAKSAKLVPPFFIDEGCVIEGNVQIGPNVIINKNTHISKNTKISSSFIDEKVTIKEDCVLNTCVVSHNCLIENKVKIEPMSIIAAFSTIGANSKIYTGARIGPNIELKNNSKIKDFVFPESLVRPPIKQKPLPLNNRENKIYSVLQESGELTFEGLAVKTQIEKQALEKSLQKLIKQNLVLSYGKNLPQIYTLTSY
jgi:NDP-sugar pyrophosphorylase family protein